MKQIDLNVDIGEGFAFDGQLVSVCTSANICCGAHSGSIELTLATLQLCSDQGLRIGAHPGYPDRMTMGRGPGSPNHRQCLLDQVKRVQEANPIDYIKPHGAFYNESQDPGYAQEILFEMLEVFKLPLMGMAGTLHEATAQQAGVALIREGFVDRRYTPEGRLCPRSQPGAVLEHLEDIVQQAIWLANRVDSLCLHGDTPDCVLIATSVKTALKAEGWAVKA